MAVLGLSKERKVSDDVESDIVRAYGSIPTHTGVLGFASTATLRRPRAVQELTTPRQRWATTPVNLHGRSPKQRGLQFNRQRPLRLRPMRDDLQPPASLP
ncbi:uncharacterized protein LOC142559566 isoform X2 [Dermacentor variabilis]|uniref:uncharacterized protein LOC142559566 isoform X2 n=1 Tax=Dermacentor variabilis TaxID=34621 RepID=UPI003F5C011A